MSIEAGLALLGASDSWVSATESTVTTVDISGPVDLRATPAFTARLVKTDITGPDGELGIALAESDGVVGSHIHRFNPPVNLSFGLLEYRARFRGTAWAQKNHLGAAAPDRWSNTPGTGSSVQMTYIIDPAVANLPDAKWQYLFTGPNKSYSYQITDLSDGWVDVVQRSHLAGTSATINLPAFRANGSITGNNNVCVEVASVEYVQSRVSAVTDVRDATVRFSESDNEKRQCLSSDLWLGQYPCFVESWNLNTEFGRTPIVNAAYTPVTAGLTVKVHNASPTLAGTVLRVGDISLMQGADKKWHITQGATDFDTGFFVASVPVCAVLRIAGGTVDLFVDGVVVASTSMAQGGTGYQIGGDNAEIIWFEESSRTTSLSDAEILALSVTMRARAHLPARWKMDCLGGQSNAYDTYSLAATRGFIDQDVLNAPGWAVKIAHESYDDTLWGNGASTEYQSGAPVYANNQGVHTGIIAASQDAHDPRTIVLCAYSGANIAHWTNVDGIMRLHTKTALDQSVAVFGTHLVDIDTMYWVQGEADASNSDRAAAYFDQLELLRDIWRADFGAQIKIVLLKLSTYTDPVCEFGSVIRSAQDAFAAAHPTDVATATPSDNPAHYSDTLHVRTWYRPFHGRALYAARRTLPVELAGLPLTAGTPTITSPTLTQLTQLTGLSITTGVPTITAGTLSLQPGPLRIVNLTYKWRATQSAGTSTANPPTFIAYRGHAIDMGVFTITAPTGFDFTGTVARLRIGRPGEAAHVEWRSDDVPSGVLFGWNDATGELSIDMPSAAVDAQEAGRYTYQITIISASGEPLGPPCVGYFRVASTVGAMLN